MALKEAIDAAKKLNMNIWKYTSRSRTLHIGGTGVGVFGVLTIVFLLTSITHSESGDIQCNVECDAYINITTAYWTVCFDSKPIFIETVPDIKTELYVPAVGGKWRLFNNSKDCIVRGKINRFKIIGHKEPEQTVKWGIDLKTSSLTDRIYHYWMSSKDLEKLNKVNCTEGICYTPEGKVGYSDMFCAKRGVIIVCDSKKDGNGDGICTSGETCIMHDILSKEVNIKNSAKLKIKSVGG